MGNREWLWQRPYALLELQHVWGTELQAEFGYRVGAESGCIGMCMAVRNIDDYVAADSITLDSMLNLNAATILDPDGYSISLLEKTNAD